MRKTCIPVLLMALALNCGNDKIPTDHSGIIVSISPTRALVDLGTTFHYSSSVHGADNQTVLWALDGGAECGTIINSGEYTAPATLPTGVDSVRIVARAQADTTKSGAAWAVLVDPSRIYVNAAGSDSTGTGSRWRPFRTITKALYRASTNQTIYVGAGQYNFAVGERFPLYVPNGITISGAGSDSSFVTSPGGTEFQRDTAFVLVGYSSTVEKLSIRSSNSMGIGVSLRQGSRVMLSECQVSQNFIGVYTTGQSAPGPLLLESNIITGDSIGVVVSGSSRPSLRNNYIGGCLKYGMRIDTLSHPDLGTNDSTRTGDNTFGRSGDGCRWLIYSTARDTILAIGNTWPNPILQENDQCIYDDDESQGASGPIILAPYR